MDQTRTTPLEVDAEARRERKRALSVLAQRRYRQRRKEKIQSLEKQVRSSTSTSTASSELSSRILEDVGLGANLPCSDEDLFGQAVAYPTQINTTNISTTAMVDFDAFLNLDGLSDVPLYSSSGSSAELQSLELSQYTFPDDSTLNIPELQTMQAGTSLAEMMGCAQTMWDLSALHIVDKQSISSNLPLSMEPTPAQKSLPHHPFFDILPWPAIRTRIIIIFSQPIHLRPPSARDPMALMNLMYDMDDSAEGVRITGEDYADGKNWEIGQAVFSNWWWVFDREVVENSNALRRRRGACRLVVPG